MPILLKLKHKKHSKCTLRDLWDHAVGMYSQGKLPENLATVEEHCLTFPVWGFYFLKRKKLKSDINLKMTRTI